MEACLILEQPSALRSIPLNYDKALEGELLVSAPLLSAPLRASIILLKGLEKSMNEAESQLSICQDVTVLRSRGLDQECHAEEGCLLRLRANSISADQVSEEERVLLVFDGPELQCVESSWGRDTPEERCGGEDLDCDGFIDEGLACSGVGE